MSDIVERLRANYSDVDSSADAHMGLEAAAEIEQLRADLAYETERLQDGQEIWRIETVRLQTENNNLRAALADIANLKYVGITAAQVARCALDGEKG